jgi:hypothetical protein
VLVPVDQIPPPTGEPPDITGLLRQLSQGRRGGVDRCTYF